MNSKRLSWEMIQPLSDDALLKPVAQQEKGGVMLRSCFLSRILFAAAVCVFLDANTIRAQSWSLAWSNRYASPFTTGYDAAKAVAISLNGNVIVAGSSYNGSNSDCTTVTYSSDGVAVWTNRYHGPGGGSDGINALAVHTNGDVIVTGYASSTNPTSYPSDYLTIKYSSAGMPLWTNLYASVGSSEDIARAVVLDSDGNVLVTGTDVTIKYAGFGQPVWTNRFPNGKAVRIAADPNGDVFVTGYSMNDSWNYDYATIKYSNTGIPVWTNRYNSIGNAADYPSAITVNRNGDVIVTGYSQSASGSNYDYATIKYSTDGVPLWTNRYEGIGADADYAAALAVDVGGNVFVTGRSIGTDHTFDYATVAYAGTGTPLWTNRYWAVAGGGDEATGIALDDSGNVFVTGRSSLAGTASSYDFVTIAYSNGGVPLQTNRFNGEASNQDDANAIAVDQNGGVYVTGASLGIGSNFDFLTLKYARPSPGAPIPLYYQFFGNQIALSWTNPAFSLQSAPNANGTFTNVLGATSPYTNSTINPQQFFRLKTF